MVRERTRSGRRAKLAAILAAILLGGGVVVAPVAQATFPGTPGLLTFGRAGYVWTMHSDGSDERRIAPGWGPEWSPDGTRIAFTGVVRAPDNSFSTYRLFVMNADGSDVRQVSDGNGVPRSADSDPAWSPDGKSLVFVHGSLDYRDDHNGDLWTLRLSDGQRRQITNDGNGWLELDPQWSPDGTRIVYVMDSAASGDEEFLLGMAPPSGLAPGETGRIDLGPTFAGTSVLQPDWSPDGTRLLVGRKPLPADTCQTINIWTVGPDGSQPEQVTHLAPVCGTFAYNASWSPDGAQIVLACYFYCAELDGKGTFVADADGSNIHRIGSDIIYARWQPLPSTARCTITGTSGADRLVGTSGPDVICAGDGDDVVYGLGGNDTLLGGGGRDQLMGGPDDDLLRGGGGNDTLSGGSGNDELRGDSGADRLVGGDGGDRLVGGDGPDSLSGGGGPDLLSGGAGNDVLAGDAGNDTLDGGGGTDTCTGGTGTDPLLFCEAEAP